MTEETRIACVAGATGLVGGHLLDALLASPAFAQVVSVGRRELARTDPKLVQCTADLTTTQPALPPCTDAFCALGTTLARAGSREAFRAVDHTAVLHFVRAAQASGATRAYVVTALGADAGSRIFYNRVKGEVERDLASLGLAELHIAQPSLLLGDRAESRPGERVAIVLSRAFAPLLQALASRPIEARTVGRAVVALAAGPRSPGVHLHPSGALHRLGA